MTPNIQKAVMLHPERAADYKWFDVGTITAERMMVMRQAELSLLLRQPMPFSNCGIAGVTPDIDGHNPVVFGMLVTKGLEGSEFEDVLFVEASVISPVTGERAKHKGFWVRSNLGGESGFKVSYADASDYKDESIRQMTRASCIILGLLLMALYDGDAQYKMYTATPSSSNVKRIRQGKQPLFSWHTVVIEPTKQKFPHQGGTHASPRLHDVRGHWVTRNGKRFWKKPHKRGDASKGVVFHDYKIKPTVMETNNESL